MEAGSGAGEGEKSQEAWTKSLEEMGPERLVKKCSKMAGWKAEDHEIGLGHSSTHTSSTDGNLTVAFSSEH